MKTIKDLFKSNHKQPLDIKPSIDDQTFEVSSNNWSSDSECHAVPAGSIDPSDLDHPRFNEP